MTQMLIVAIFAVISSFLIGLGVCATYLIRKLSRMSIAEFMDWKSEQEGNFPKRCH